MSKNSKYYAVYKPYGYLSQFTPITETDLTLKDLFSFEDDVYPIGRLDKDSEGLLVLTNDKKLNAQLLHPKQKIWKTYWAQVEGIPDQESIESIINGVEINLKGRIYITKKAKSKMLNPQPQLEERNPPIRFRKNIPETWIELSICEGKNRQVRRMFAKIGFPVLRLIRVGIANFNINEEWKIGDVREINLNELL